MAASTGGPDALSQVLPHWDLHVPVLIVQHMPASFTKMLAERLDDCCPMSVEEARDGDIAEPGRVLVAAGGFHLRLRGSADRAEVYLTDEPQVNSLRPAADVTFRDAVALWGSDVLGVVLTGMGRDGVRGARAIAAAGGMVLAQDEASSAVWGMPGEIVDAGLATAVLPLDRFATTVPTLCRRPIPSEVSLPRQPTEVDLTAPRPLRVDRPDAADLS